MTTTTTPTITDPHATTDAARAGRSADQERLARHLAEVARRRLAGEDEAGAEIVGRQPREVIVLGVLPPRDPEREAVNAADDGTADIPHEPGVPIDQLPSSELGLTCLVAPEARHLVFQIAARFAVYLQHFPTHAQQSQYLLVGQRAVPGDATAPDETTGTDDDPVVADVGDVIVEDASEEHSEVVEDVGDVIAEVVESGHDEEGDTEGGGVGDRRRRWQRRGDPLVPVYRRYDVAVTFPISVAVPMDARPVIVEEVEAFAGAIRAEVSAQQDGGAAGGLYRRLTGNSQRVPRDVVDAGPDAYEQHLRSRLPDDWELPLPNIGFIIGAQRQGNHVRVALTLANHSLRPSRERGFLPELAVYDAEFSAAMTGGTFANMGFALADEDYRVHPVAYAHGRFCYLDPACDPTTGVVATTTWPIFRQAVFESRADLQPSYSELIDDPVRVLRRIGSEMDAYHKQWQAYLDSGVLTGDAAAACDRDRAVFEAEMQRFHAGIEIIATNAEIAEAFRWMNEAFLLLRTPRLFDPTREGPAPQPEVTTWRLFQIVFIVANLAALACREHDNPEWRAELDYADVLWFPTGGGKSDALFGAVATAMFYDRLRGKNYGTTALVRFPLRMLSVQQLERVLGLVVACEHIRARAAAAGRDLGEPFSLGYFVGKSNTPNKLTDASDRRWGDIRSMAARPDDWKRDRVVVPTCCYCASPTVLEPNVADVRLYHRCTNAACGQVLPVIVTDDEVYRYLPAIVVATVDKAATVAWNPHFSHLTHGPRYRCPDHGFVTFAYGGRQEKRCMARGLCTREPSEWISLTAKDPAPAFVVQDELHLLAEDLGTFAAHYETLWQWLTTRIEPHLPSKVLAATATISDYAQQVHQLYALIPRRFPTDGYLQGESFYARTHEDLTRRLFVGALPSQVDVVEFSLLAGKTMRGEIERLRAQDPAAAVAELGLLHYQPDELAELLFGFELQLYYANRKTHADRVHSEMAAAGSTGDPAYFRSVRLNGQTPLPEISEAIRRVEHETLVSPPAHERLAVIAGTSLVSHGVDLERLNVQFMMGMPSTVAYYVQATSRAGRSGVGLIFCVLSRSHPRDRSVFHFFEPQHEYVNHLVEPVALNRFSVHGPQKTAPGLVAGIILNDWGRNEARIGAGCRPIHFGFAEEFRAWLPRTPASVEDDLRDEIRASYGLDASVLDTLVARQFAERVNLLVAQLLQAVRGSNESTLQGSMRPRPPTSFRDIDAPVDFGTFGARAREAFRLLSGYTDTSVDPDAEVETADESDND